MELTVLNQAGAEVKKINLNPSVFNVDYNNQVIFDVVIAQRAAQRQGTHKVKSRTEVRGGGRKPFRQKGTGRARQGSIRAPQWRGGGVVFGPTPRSYEVKINRKVAQLALRIALSEKVRNNKLVILDSVKVEGKTKEFIEILNNIKVEGKVLFGTKEIDEILDRSSRNYPYAFVEQASHISVLEIVDANYLVLTEEAVKYFEEGLNNE